MAALTDQIWEMFTLITESVRPFHKVLSCSCASPVKSPSYRESRVCTQTTLILASSSKVENKISACQCHLRTYKGTIPGHLNVSQSYSVHLSRREKDCNRSLHIETGSLEGSMKSLQTVAHPSHTLLLELTFPGGKRVEELGTECNYIMSERCLWTCLWFAMARYEAGIWWEFVLGQEEGRLGCGEEVRRKWKNGKGSWETSGQVTCPLFPPWLQLNASWKWDWMWGGWPLTVCPS